jgi:hypothetical protein
MLKEMIGLDIWKGREHRIRIHGNENNNNRKMHCGTSDFRVNHWDWFHAFIRFLIWNGFQYAFKQTHKMKAILKHVPS